MKIATGNKLAHLQVEYNEICEQNKLLQMNLQTSSTLLQQYQGYLQMNGGDRNVMAQYRNEQTKYKSLMSQINRNNYRLASLSRRIQQESARMQARAMGYGRTRRW